MSVFRTLLLYLLVIFMMPLDTEAQNLVFTTAANKTNGTVKQSPSVVTPTVTTVNIGIMLPLHNLDNDGRRMVEYYRGMLLAVKRLKSQGVNVNIHAWNLSQNANVSSILNEAKGTKLDMIFGPLYTKQVDAVASYCDKNNIRLIIPFSINGNPAASHKSVFQTYQSDYEVYLSSIRHFMELNPDFHTIIIDCNDSSYVNKNYVTEMFRGSLVDRGMKYYITNLNSPDGSFANCFRANEHNVVMLTSSRSAELTAALRKLTAMKDLHPDYQITLLGYTDWFLLTKQHSISFARFDTYIPSTYYYNAVSGMTKSLETLYRLWFHTGMMEAIPRFALTGYDQGMFFIGGFHQYGDAFNGSETQQYTTPLQTPYNFQQESGNAGYNNRFFEFVHYKNDGSIESLRY